MPHRDIAQLPLVNTFYQHPLFLVPPQTQTPQLGLPIQPAPCLFTTLTCHCLQRTHLATKTLDTEFQNGFLKVRLGAHWQLNCCGDATVAVNVCALQLNSCLYWQLFFFQYRMDFTETACVCALLLRIREDERKKRYWVHPVVSKRLLNGQFYKLCEDLRKCRGKFYNYFRMSI